MPEWKLVPVEPTEEMLRAMEGQTFNVWEVTDVWKSALAVSPSPLVGEDLVERVARAICKGRGFTPDMMIVGISANPPARQWERYKEAARAVLSILPDRNAVIEECARVAEALPIRGHTWEDFDRIDIEATAKDAARAILALRSAPSPARQDAFEKMRKSLDNELQKVRAEIRDDGMSPTLAGALGALETVAREALASAKEQ